MLHTTCGKINSTKQAFSDFAIHDESTHELLGLLPIFAQSINHTTSSEVFIEAGLFCTFRQHKISS